MYRYRKNWKRFILPVAVIMGVISLFGWGIYYSIQEYKHWEHVKKTCAYTKTIPGFHYKCQTMEYDFLNEEWELVDSRCWQPPKDCYMCDGGEECK